jgi:hypothetical protein
LEKTLVTPHQRKLANTLLTLAVPFLGLGQLGSDAAPEALWEREALLDWCEDDGIPELLGSLRMCGTHAFLILVTDMEHSGGLSR